MHPSGDSLWTPCIYRPWHLCIGSGKYCFLPVYVPAKRKGAKTGYRLSPGVEENLPDSGSMRLHHGTCSLRKLYDFPGYIAKCLSNPPRLMRGGCSLWNYLIAIWRSVAGRDQCNTDGRQIGLCITKTSSSCIKKQKRTHTITKRSDVPWNENIGWVQLLW